MCLPISSTDLPALWARAQGSNSLRSAVGLLSIAGIASLRHFVPWFPGSLLVIAAASAARGLAAAAGGHDLLALRRAAVGPAAPHPARQHRAGSASLLPSAFVIAFLAAVESLLSAIVADRMIGGRHRSSAELLAQGAANIVSPLFGGLPATGAIARTATNVRAADALLSPGSSMR